MEDVRSGNSHSIRSCYSTTPTDVSLITDELKDVFSSKFITNFGKYNQLFEERLKELLNVPFVLTTSNASTALDILMSTLPKGKEVIVPSFTFAATVHAIMHGGLAPRFVDIDKDTYNVSISDLKNKINENTVAILATHCFGNPCPIEALEEIAKAANLKLYFDSAPALGAKYKGKPLGSFGDAEVFSLSGNKIITTGEGGFITTRNKELAEYVSSMRNYGYSSDKTDCLYYGFNGKLSEYNAVFGLWGLGMLKEEIASRKELAEIYVNELGNVPGIGFQQALENCVGNFSFYPIEFHENLFGTSAQKLTEKLREYNIHVRRYFAPLVHETSAYSGYNQIRLNVSEMLSNSIVCLPLHSSLRSQDLRYVCYAIKEIFSKNRQENTFENSFLEKDSTVHDFNSELVV